MLGKAPFSDRDLIPLTVPAQVYREVLRGNFVGGATSFWSNATTRYINFHPIHKQELDSVIILSMPNEGHYSPEDIIKEAKKQIPGVDKIIEETWEELGLNEEMIKNSFGLVLVEFDRLATEKFRYY